MTAAVRDPLAVGENVMLTAHEELAAILAGQVLFEIAKSPGFAPVRAIDESATALLPVLLTVTLCAALVVPVFCTA